MYILKYKALINMIMLGLYSRIKHAFNSSEIPALETQFSLACLINRSLLAYLVESFTCPLKSMSIL